MRAVVQRVSSASVAVDGKQVGHIGAGLLVLLGVAPDDGPDDTAFMVRKLSWPAHLRRRRRSDEPLGGRYRGILSCRQPVHALRRRGSRQQAQLHGCRCWERMPMRSIGTYARDCGTRASTFKTASSGRTWRSVWWATAQSPSSSRRTAARSEQSKAGSSASKKPGQLPRLLPILMQSDLVD